MAWSQWELSLPYMCNSPSLVTRAVVPLLQAAVTTNVPSILVNFLGLTAFNCLRPLSINKIVSFKLRLLYWLWVSKIIFWLSKKCKHQLMTLCIKRRPDRTWATFWRVRDFNMGNVWNKVVSRIVHYNKNSFTLKICISA